MLCVDLPAARTSSRSTPSAYAAAVSPVSPDAQPESGSEKSSETRTSPPEMGGGEDSPGDGDAGPVGDGET